MRYLYFLILLAISAAFVGGGFYFSRNLSSALEKSAISASQANLLAEKFEDFEKLNKAREASTLLFAGDVMLSRFVGREIVRHKAPAYPFLKIADTLSQADLTFGNLEGPISSRGKNQSSSLSFRADPQAVAGLKFAGFDVMSLANNHIWDWGRVALGDTISILEENGIKPVGAGRNFQEANTPAILEAKGTKIAFFAFTNLYPKGLEAKKDAPGISRFDTNAISEAIRLVRPSVDIVVVSFHWGDEYKTRSNSKQQEIGHALVDAGADLIVGHHPHVIQEIEQYPPSPAASEGRGRHGWIAYSLGNFVFDQNFQEEELYKETMRGLMLEVRVQGGKIVGVEPIEIKINPTFQPFLPEL